LQLLLIQLRTDGAIGVGSGALLLVAWLIDCLTIAWRREQEGKAWAMA
jgi:hypothetical protein